jgi:molybdenum cofactor synthesis domain-containing protein
MSSNDQNVSPKRVVTAAVLLIGDELLSGRTKDVNLATIASFLAPYGVQVREARVVSDDHDDIVAAINALRVRYDYVFTTGGIGPTHDDITADAVAAAFGVGISVRDDAREILEKHYGDPSKLNEARLRMARIPDGAVLILNPVSKAPGFQTGNVFTMAGVPSVMRGMLDDIGHRLEGGAVMLMRQVRGAGLREGDLSAPLEALAGEMPDVSFGSYPFWSPEAHGVVLVARSLDENAINAALDALFLLMRNLGVEPEAIAPN